MPMRAPLMFSLLLAAPALAAGQAGTLSPAGVYDPAKALLAANAVRATAGTAPGEAAAAGVVPGGVAAAGTMPGAAAAAGTMPGAAAVAVPGTPGAVYPGARGPMNSGIDFSSTTENLEAQLEKANKLHKEHVTKLAKQRRHNELLAQSMPLTKLSRQAQDFAARTHKHVQRHTAAAGRLAGKVVGRRLLRAA